MMMMMMRSRYSYSSLVLMLALMASASMAAEGPRVFKVGDDFGWRVPLPNDTAVYSHWASSNRFHIAFVYDKDSVMEVDKWAFYHCNASDPITAFDNGNSKFDLDRPGLFYFISGSNARCTSGQRLIVQVMHVHHHQHDIASMSPSMSPISSVSAASASHPFAAAAAAFLTVALVSFLTLL